MKQPTPSSAIAELGKNQCNVVGTPDYVKVACILILVKGHTLSVVSDCLGIELLTVYRYVAVYQSKGKDGSLESRHKAVIKVIWGFLTAVSCPFCARNCVSTSTRMPRAWWHG